MSWQSIDTNPIPRGVPVLTRRVAMSGKQLYSVAKYEKVGYASGLHVGDGVFLMKVTHWMEIPEVNA